jgi:hypothetical protein
MNALNVSRTVLHLVHEAPDPFVLGVIEAQKEAGFPVELIRLDEVTDWKQVVDQVLSADSVCSW